MILCADDYGITAGVCDGIDELVAADRLSATSAIVTLPSWTDCGKRLGRLRERIAIGLHVNLTLGAPLGEMPTLAPAGRVPGLRQLLAACFSARVDREEISAEVSRQIARFEEVTGHAPDFIDGHQHVHVLPGIRRGFLQAIGASLRERRPLIRDPDDSAANIVRRRCATGKALGLAALAIGFGAQVRKAGFPTNHGFAGASAFDPSASYAHELARACSYPGRRHLVMCHPGYPDAELAALDAVVDRRRDELDAILSFPALPETIWHAGKRDGNGLPLWPGHGAL
jgi:predicted glycoside hydrolase/deacetylase ChbG (UPF0249 family)